MGSYTNPAELFLKTHTIDSVEDIINFADFLRKEAGLSCDPPVNLQLIIDRFGMHSPKAIPLPQQQGATVSFSGIPQILFHDGDVPTRQRYTTAHELIELLFSGLPGTIRFDGRKTNIFGILGKERICQIGAANLLMPEESFKIRAAQLGLNFLSAELLADEYKVSLMASLCRLVDMYPKQASVVLWQMRNKPTEIKKKVPEIQLSMPGFPSTTLDAPKLRVSWSYGKFQGIFIPVYKSIPEDSSVYTAWEDDQFKSEEENMPFGKYNKRAVIESKPIRINDEKSILSMIR